MGLVICLALEMFKKEQLSCLMGKKVQSLTITKCMLLENITGRMSLHEHTMYEKESRTHGNTISKNSYMVFLVWLKLRKIILDSRTLY